MALIFCALPRRSKSVLTSSLLLFVLAWSNAQNFETYSSSVKLLEKLAVSDVKIARVLYRRRDKIPASSKLRTKVNSFLEHFEEGTGLKGQVRDWKGWAANLTKKDVKKLSRKTARDLSSIGMDAPEMKDVVDTVEGLLRLQQIHDFNTLDMASGLVAGISTGVTLNAPDCYTIGDLGREMEFWALSVEWLTLWNLKLQQEQEETGSKVEFILREAENKLLELANKHDDRLSNEPGNVTFFATPLNLTSDKIGEFTKNLQFPLRQRTKLALHHEKKMHWQTNFWALCQGQRLQTEKERSQLFCWLERQVHPYFLIGPLKTEVIARRPVILQYYDVAGLGLRQKFANYSRTNASLNVNRITHSVFSVPVFEESGPSSMDWPTPPNLTFEIGKSVRPTVYFRYMGTYIDELNETLGVPAFMRTIQMSTGLNRDTKKSRLLPYYTYNFGQQLEPHIDKADEEEEEVSGMRIATFMTYMSNVAAGGETVFPFAGVGVKPTKGSALLWFNIRRNGLELDPWAIHAACPPLIGEKAITTRWIFYNAQFQNFKCGLHKDDEFDWNFFMEKYKSLNFLLKPN